MSRGKWMRETIPSGHNKPHLYFFLFFLDLPFKRDIMGVRLTGFLSITANCGTHIKTDAGWSLRLIFTGPGYPANRYF